MTDLAATLSSLKHNLQTATQFSKPWDQFHDEVAMVPLYTQLAVPAKNPHLERCIKAVAGHLFKVEATIEDPCFLNLPDQHFWHGTCLVAGRVAIGFYFDDDNIGLVGFMRSLTSVEVQLARLRPIEIPPGSRVWGGRGGGARRN